MGTVLINPSAERRILDFRPLGFRDVAVLGRYRYAAAHEPLPEHTHGNMLEICYLESGAQVYTIGDERFELTGGDLFLTLPDETHGTGDLPENKGVLFWMLLHLPSRGRFLSLAPSEARLLLDQLLHPPSRQFRGGRPAKQTLHEIFDVYDRDDDPLRVVHLRNLFLRFLLGVIEASGAAAPRPSRTMCEVQEFIDQNLDVMLSIRQLAQLAGMSQSRFKARFKSEVGIPPADYVMRQKIDHAKQLLRDHHKVTAVAMQLGFTTSQYFATVFKRYTGKSPTEFRRSA